MVKWLQNIKFFLFFLKGFYFSFISEGELCWVQHSGFILVHFILFYFITFARTWTMYLLALVACMVSEKKCTASMIGEPLKWNWCSSLAHFTIFTLYFWMSEYKASWLKSSLITSIWFLWVLCTSMSMSLFTLGKFSAVTILNKFSKSLLKNEKIFHILYHQRNENLNNRILLHNNDRTFKVHGKWT